MVNGKLICERCHNERCGSADSDEVLRRFGQKYLIRAPTR